MIAGAVECALSPTPQRLMIVTCASLAIAASVMVGRPMTAEAFVYWADEHGIGKAENSGALVRKGFIPVRKDKTLSSKES